ncbi:uroporphyrinogen-III synthase [Georgenia soli]|uniref:Uroporphyrinogen-III synthase n=1 Tax=Georgenia soli TaxID=638953 RepID=A0A2A9EP68_9MICO|nr:uroporphyrinogen-III synthase [Georgenia soli]PFG40030.1 uroporphyrinogen-III synthase [Georgenia soli]
MTTSGPRVLVPRTRSDDTVVTALREAGYSPVPTALVTSAPVDPPDELDRALHALGEGAHSWLAVTSATTVRVLLSRAAALGTTLPALVGNTPVAAVGPATAAALNAAGVDVALVPDGTVSSAAALVESWPAAPRGGIVLLPRSEIAAPTLATGLRERGWLVDDVVAYRTVTARPADPAVAADLAAGRIDAVLLTSGSTATALVELYGPLPDQLVPGPRLVAIGSSTAEVAARVGLTVHAVAAEQTPSGLVAALGHALAHRSEQHR